MRAVSWNVANRVGDGARREGEFLASLDPPPDVVMLREVNRGSIEMLCERAQLDWWSLAADIRKPERTDTPVRQRGVALAGRGRLPTALGVLADVPLPERTIHGVVQLGGTSVCVASFHAPPGVSWFEKKAQQAVGFAEWLAAIEQPVILGADANTPLVDHPDFEAVRTHWHSGKRRLHGAPGDDRLWAATKIHGLEDALRSWLRQNPQALAEIRALRPTGPLAVSHYTGKRANSPGVPRRFDSIWISTHFAVTAVAYPYEESIRAGSDHAAVVVDFVLRGGVAKSVGAS